MAEVVRKLVKKRAGHRGDLTTIIRSIDQCLESKRESMLSDLEGLKLVLLNKFTKLQGLDEEIYDKLADDQNISEEDLTREASGASDIEIKVQTKVQLIERLTTTGSQRNESEVGSTTASSVLSSNNQRVKLPKIELQRFNGDPQKWQAFWDTYDSLIHSNEDLNEIDKFNYLRSVLSGEALSAIEGFSTTGGNYKQVIEVLRDRFGKKAFIISSHMESILKLPDMSGADNTKKLRRTFDKLETHIRSLQSLGIESKQFGPLLVPVLLDRLPGELALIVSREYDAKRGDIWELENLLNALRNEIEARERSGYVSVNTRPNRVPTLNSQARSEFTGHALFSAEATRAGTKKTNLCAYCNLPHRPENCRTVTNLNARREHLKKTAKCFNCLEGGHLGRQCRSQDRCFKCRGKHHVSLCLADSNPSKKHSIDEKVVAGSANRQTEAGQITMVCNVATSILMQTGRALVSSTAGGRPKNVRIVFDCGSQRSFVTEELKEALTLQSLGKRNLRISRFMDAEISSDLQTNESFDLVQISVKGIDGTDIVVTACSVPQICPPPNSQLVGICKENFPHLKGLKLADENLERAFRGDSIDVLVGLDYYWAFIIGGIRRGGSGPVALQSRIGWLLSGPMVVPDDEEVSSQAMLILQNDQDAKLDNLVEKFWSLEAVGIIDKSEADVLHKFSETVCFNQTSGRYQVSLPWRENMGVLEDNYSLCHKRLMNQLHRFHRDPNLYEAYNAVMKEHIETGILEPVSKKPPDVGQAFYLPHHGVLREDHSTTKLRVVYDGSSSTVGPSLNQMLHEGPCLLPELLKILMRFRCRKYAFVADVQQAFLQIEIAEKDRNFLRTLWVKDFDPNKFSFENPTFGIQELRFTRCVFGVTSSPFHLLATFRHHLAKYQETQPQIVDEVINSMYVDDLVSGADSVRAGCKLFVEAKRMLSEGGFNLRKFATNSSELEALVLGKNNQDNTAISVSAPSYAELTQPSIEHPMGGDELKVLGVLWNRSEDKLVFRFDHFLSIAKTTPFTKRGLLQLIARIYDPLGLLSPMMVTLKCAFQKACKLKIPWDSELPEELSNIVKSWLKSLSDVDSIEFPRYCFVEDRSSIKSVKLIGFSDASEIAFGGIIYVRVESESRIHVNIFASRSRVVPIKDQSIPRLELLGCLLLAKLFAPVRQSVGSIIDIESEQYFSDSYTALCWVRNKRQHYKQFVEQRASKIRALTDIENWNHVKGCDNPADLATRGLSPTDLKNCGFWFSGPTWMSLPVEDWPVKLEEVRQTSESIAEMKAEDRRSENVMLAIEHDRLIEFERFGTWVKLKRTVAFVKRFVFNLKNKMSRKVGELEGDEIAGAETVLIKLVQSKLLPDHGNKLDNRDLRIFTDLEGLVRCRGRLENSELESQRKYPLLLPTNHPISELIVRDAHKRVLHSGVNETMICVRNKFWIPKLRQLTRRLINKCVLCKWIDGRSYSKQQFPWLPKFRVSASVPFETSGVDFAGPLYVKPPGSNNEGTKVYIFLMTCMWSRSIHLELVEDLASATCILGLRRFFARRGVPNLILSDNAKAFKSKEIKAFLRDRGVKWEFTTPRAPWTGGVWERMIRITKRCLKKVLRKTSLSLAELVTVLTEVELVVNNRPLTYVDSHSLEEPLTPSHLLHGRILPVVAIGNESSHIELGSDFVRRRILYRQRVVRDFCRRWELEYLSALREAHRGNNPSHIRNPRVGDIVLVHEQVPRLNWQLGRIVELFAGSDGLVRSALVKLGRTNNTVKRAITCLYPLEVNECESEGVSASALEPVSGAGLSTGLSDDRPCSKGVADKLRERSKDTTTPTDELLEFATRQETSMVSRPSRAAAKDAIFKRRILQQT